VTDYTDDDIQAAGDDLRDIIESSLIVSDPPAPGWAPDPKDLA
jgi:hypothetical protein